MKQIENFNQSYKAKVLELESLVAEKFKTARNQNLAFLSVFNKTNDDLKNLLEEWLSKKDLREAYELFLKNRDHYRGEIEEQITSVLDHDLKEYYTNRKLSLPYDDFIKNIAIARALDTSRSNFRNNSTPYGFMYELNNFKDFTLNNIRSTNPKLTKILRLKLHPEPGLQSPTKKKKDWSREIDETNEFLGMFNDDEKKYLLKAFYQYLSGNFHKKGVYSDFKELMPATEFAKLTLIISSIQEPDVFYKTADRSNISKSISREFTNPEIKILRNLNSKLEKYNLKQIKAFINGLIVK